MQPIHLDALLGETWHWEVDDDDAYPADKREQLQAIPDRLLTALGHARHAPCASIRSPSRLQRFGPAARQRDRVSLPSWILRRRRDRR